MLTVPKKANSMSVEMGPSWHHDILSSVYHLNNLPAKIYLSIHKILPFLFSSLVTLEAGIKNMPSVLVEKIC